MAGTRFEGKPPSKINKFELAADIYRQVLSMNPNDTTALCNLASCFDYGVVILKPEFDEIN